MIPARLGEALWSGYSGGAEGDTVKTQEFIAGSRSSIQRKVKAWRDEHPGIVELRYTLREAVLPAGRVPTKRLEKKFVTARIDYED